MFECLYGYADVRLGSHGTCLTVHSRPSFPPFVSNSVSGLCPYTQDGACLANVRTYPPRTFPQPPTIVLHYTWLCFRTSRTPAACH